MTAARSGSRTGPSRPCSCCCLVVLPPGLALRAVQRRTDLLLLHVALDVAFYVALVHTCSWCCGEGCSSRHARSDGGADDRGADPHRARGAARRRGRRRQAAAEPVDLLVRDGVIAEIAPRVEATGCLELEADGRWVIPGLWDQHVHMTQWARNLQPPRPRVGTRSPHEVIERLCRRPARHRVLGIVVGFGYRHRQLDRAAHAWPLLDAGGRRAARWS